MSTASDGNYSLAKDNFPNSSANNSNANTVKSPTELRETPPAVILTSAGYDHTIRFWDVIQGTCIGTLQHNESQVNCLALSRDKLLLAAGGNPAIRLYDVISATISSSDTLGDLNNGTTASEHSLSTVTANILPIHVFEGHKSNVLAVGFHSECKWMWSVSEDGEVRIWDLQGEFGCRKELAVGPLTAAVLHPNQEHLVVADEGGKVRVISIADGGGGESICETRLETITAIRDVAISFDGALVAAIDHKGRLHAWRLDSTINNRITLTSDEDDAVNEESLSFRLIFFASVNAHAGYGIKCLFSPDATTILTTSADTTARLWASSTTTSEVGGEGESTTTTTLQLIQEFIGHTKWVWDCAFSADSAYVITASSDESIRLWDVNSGLSIAVYSGHSKVITCVALNDLSLQ